MSAKPLQLALYFGSEHNMELKCHKVSLFRSSDNADSTGFNIELELQLATKLKRLDSFSVQIDALKYCNTPAPACRRFNAIWETVGSRPKKDCK